MDGRFVYRKTWLPESNGKQTALDQIRRFIEEFHPSDDSPTWVYTDYAEFGVANRANGKRQILFPREALAIRSRQRRHRQPRLPKIQVLLNHALQYRERLKQDPYLTRDALASEAGMSPTRLTMILNLLKLAPDIQEHILAMSPCLGGQSITERKLRPLTHMQDHAVQRQEFQKFREHCTRSTMLSVVGVANSRK